MSTEYTPRSNSNFDLEQAEHLSADFENGRVLCWEDSASTPGQFQSARYAVYFDPTAIINNTARYDAHRYLRYRESLGGLSTAEVHVNFENEREAGINVPGGVCYEIELRSEVFDLRVQNTIDSDHYTITGRAKYYCRGIF